MSSIPLPATPPNRKPRNVLVGVIVAVVSLLFLAGSLYQSLSERRDLHAHPIPGQLIDVDPYEMHIYCIGSGSPAVILDSGMGDTYVSWQKVQPQIARFTQVCSYDRAGIGFSYYTRHPSTSKDFAQELHILLHNAGVPPPYVLVGHSMGGFDVRLFATLYRSEAAGMVLVDSSHPQQQKRLPPAINDLDATWLREQEFFEFTMPFGIPRLLGFCGNDAAVRAVDCNFHSVRESVAELKAVSKSAAQTAATASLGDMPLVVLSHDPDTPQLDLPEDLVKPANDAWEQMQQELTHLSTSGKQIIAKNSGHYIQLDRPDLVVEVVHSVVGQARQAQPAPEPKR
jgi:pimeloyl-ACP methyl ester carboxylesterase